jgi:hypothetical protein
MKRVLLVILFGVIGLCVGYMLGVSYFCSGKNAGNLCGLPAAFITGPLGAAAAVQLSLKLFRRS